MDFVDSREGIQEGLNKEKKEVFLSRGKINTALILNDVRAGGIYTLPNPAEQTSAGEKKRKKKNPKSCHRVKHKLELQALGREERTGGGKGSERALRAQCTITVTLYQQ